jgi:hypothetical protein
MLQDVGTSEIDLLVEKRYVYIAVFPCRVQGLENLCKEEQRVKLSLQ